MRQTRVPAQMTTVEDKIAGNLSFPQILLLIGALFFATFVYLVFPKPLQLTLYKIPLMVLFVSTFLLLAIRVKGRVVVTWLLLIASFCLRPHYYVFNKNDITCREPVFEEAVKKTKAYHTQKAKVETKTEKPSIAQLAIMQQLLLDPERNVSFAPDKKGVINVSVS